MINHFGIEPLITDVVTVMSRVFCRMHQSTILQKSYSLCQREGGGRPQEGDGKPSCRGYLEDRITGIGGSRGVQLSSTAEQDVRS